MHFCFCFLCLCAVTCRFIRPWTIVISWCLIGRCVKNHIGITLTNIMKHETSSVKLSSRFAIIFTKWLHLTAVSLFLFFFHFQLNKCLCKILLGTQSMQKKSKFCWTSYSYWTISKLFLNNSKSFRKHLKMNKKKTMAKSKKYFLSVSIRFSIVCSFVDFAHLFVVVFIVVANVYLCQ